VNQKKIGVLMGGLSNERNVSLDSGAAVLQALLNRDYNAIGIDVGRDLPEVLRRESIEVAFIALHGRYGEDGCVQGMLELLGIPYTGSGVLASALAMHKRYAKSLFLAHGLMTAPFRNYRKGDDVNLLDLPFDLPIVVKPTQSDLR